MHQGGCLCGRVRYRYDGEIDELSYCHCRQCQKAQGAAFVAVAPVRARNFEITSGAGLLKAFRATPGKARVFCGECGSPIYSARDDAPEVKRLRVGTLDTSIAPARQYHAFVASKASWYEIRDELPRHRGLPPE